MKKVTYVASLALASCWLASQALGGPTGYVYIGHVIKDRDPDTSGKTGKAKITGKITPGKKVESVIAISRFRKKMIGGGKVYKKKWAFPAYQGKVDRETGKFTIPDLRNGTYDLVVMTPEGKIEGFHLRLEREFRRDMPLTERMAKKFLKDFDGLMKVSAFCNKIRLLGYDGNGEFVRALVEKARTRDFHSGKGQYVWRLESWVLVNYTGSWKHHQMGNEVYYRERYADPETIDRFRKSLWVFDRKLGGLKISRGKDVEGFEYVIPEKWDRSMGKTPGYIFDEELK